MNCWDSHIGYRLLTVPYRLALNLKDKINFLKSNMLYYQIPISTIHEKLLKSKKKTRNVKWSKGDKDIKWPNGIKLCMRYTKMF